MSAYTTPAEVNRVKLNTSEASPTCFSHLYQYYISKIYIFSKLKSAGGEIFKVQHKLIFNSKVKSFLKNIKTVITVTGLNLVLLFLVINFFTNTFPK